MKTSVRDIIVNALDEAGLVNRNQPVPANMFVTAFTLFQKRLNQYSNTNLLSFTRKEIDLKPNTESTLIGDYELTDDYIENTNFFYQVSDLPTAIGGMVAWDKDCVVGKTVLNDSTYEWELTTYSTRAKAIEAIKDCFIQIPDVEVSNLQNTVICYKKSCNFSGNDWIEMNFVAYEDFYKYANNSEVYTILPISDSGVRFIVKTTDIDKEFKLIYNERFDFDKDSELRIPNQFISLFTAGLVYDLAIQFPRLSDSTVSLLKSRLDELEENVRTSSSVNKFIARPITRETLSYDSFISGRFLNI